ncbi:MAG TPA: 3-oxoacyl-ACP synthase [Cytophagaceae bacterium]
MMTIKQALYNKCVEYVNERLSATQKAIQEAQAAANEETKSSVGDKYETGRAMLQLEIEKMSAQLAEGMKLKQSLSRINPEKEMETAELGSLVETSGGIFFLSISLGQIKLDDKTYFVISPATPIGTQLLGLKKGDSFTFNNKSISILSIY